MTSPFNKRITPHYKRVLGTRCVVDAFTYQSDDHSAYFLSHFHSDHYTGLRSSYKRSTPIYASEITAKLVIAKLKVNEQYITILPMNTEVKIEEENNTSVILLDANHCPGAVLFLFNVNNIYHLHTGDMRYHPKMKLYKELENISIHTLYLDTTYCDNTYSFPPQNEAILSCIDIMKKEKKPKTLFVIGSYTIGKERIFLEAAKEFNTKVFVLPDKYQILCHVGIDRTLLTMNPSETFIHVVPMKTLSYTGITTLYQGFKYKYKRIVGFKPTGWSLGKKPFVNYHEHTVYSIPYSEHSSIIELREFVKWLKPNNIVPTVSGGDPKKVEAMIKELYREPKKLSSLFSFFGKIKDNSHLNKEKNDNIDNNKVDNKVEDNMKDNKEDYKKEDKNIKENIINTKDSIPIIDLDSQDIISKKSKSNIIKLEFEDFDVDKVDLMFVSQQKWIEKCIEKEKALSNCSIIQSNISQTGKRKRDNQENHSKSVKKRKLSDIQQQKKLPSFFSHNKSF